ncbi:methionine aminotransferase [Spongiimicrobium sp. 3-5]|uniref:methionine aminotransferase n=1 Tax=Spongiimicrobium sp. 3-5 TaxID=3332596 RepID=UPI0039800A50
MPIFNNQVAPKLPNVKTSIFTTMSKLAAEQNAINLSQGFPNFEPDPLLLKLVTDAMQDGYNQYAPMAGIFSLREAISRKNEALYGVNYHPETEITVTVGATQAIFTIITTFIGAGDEVIVFKPAYDCYEPAIEINGGVPVYVSLKGQGFKVDWDHFRSKITDKTKMVIINTPHNPSGTILSQDDLLQLQESLRNTDVIVISDEVYEHIIFDGQQHESVARYPDLAARSFICASFGKTFHTTGWKMGYCIAPKVLMKEFQKTHEFNVFCANHPMQRALAHYLSVPQHYLSLNGFYQEKRDLFLSQLQESRFKIIPCQGTYFQLLDYSEITDEHDVDFAKRLVMNHGLASIPISVFTVDQKDDKLLRFCFAKTTETLEKAAAILRNI